MQDWETQTVVPLCVPRLRTRAGTQLVAVRTHLLARVVPFLLHVPRMIIACATTQILFPRLNHMYAHSRIVLRLLVV